MGKMLKSLQDNYLAADLIQRILPEELFQMGLVDHLGMKLHFRESYQS